jgi:hypothetical protein
MATPQQVRRRGRWSLILGTIFAFVAFAAVAYASDVDVAVVDVTVPTNSVTLAPGGSGNITINLSITGNQAGTATFEVYRDWTLSGGTFTGSNPQEFTVSPRAGGDPATTFSTTGTVSVAAGQAGGTFTLAVGALDITNSNATGAKLEPGDVSNYQVTVPSDTTAPSISYVLDPATPDGSNGWYRSDVSLTWTVIENESASSLVKTGCVNQNITADQAETTYSCSAISAGGSAGPVNVSIKRDGTNPTISGLRSPVANGNGWNDTDVAVSFECGDNLSGVVSCGPNTTLSAEGAAQSAVGNATDKAGNTASTTVSNINIDKTNPTVAVTGFTDGDAFIKGAVLPIPGCTSDDLLSGIASTTGPVLKSGTGLNANGVGSATYVCSATDNAGNAEEAESTFSVHYAFNGFFKPVENNSVNVAKAGSSIPVKFSLGGDQGLGIFAAGFPKVVAVNCSTLTDDPTDPVEEYATGTANSGLTYDAAAGQYNYVWKTDKAWAGKCFRLEMKLNDGTPAKTLNFKFTK